MGKAKMGDKVKVNFTGTLDDGTVFDSTEDCHDDECGCETGPLEFTIGDDEVFPDFERAVVGLLPGESRTVKIPAAQAYGEWDKEMVVVVNRAEMPADVDPQVGQVLEVTNDDGDAFPVTVAQVTDTEVTLDANHPLAGKDLTFDIKLVEIV